ncbi:DEAD/DEAH box helicase [Rhizobium leguminosarum]|uniref:DEAD/DEAH box helicase n=1 Tax=Rhizobium leguminosarum TaxID=384 RepID=UPI00102FEF13|nr:DEAD/DEAH box helicase [Rhizobium leguminosarum]TAV92051.1 DEAD/DEAH box helicase [Rhizobium leguminosarum]TAV96659.1 DEAD/DEAH box helicase [Rhizobium leguminosarum]TAW37736.1 DEAD/DEAH box helicase [Rhizobium leguminosarum]
MRPEGNSLSLLSVTRAKAKMYEFRVPEAEHIDLPRHPSQLYSLAIGLLGDAASWIADGGVEPTELFEDLLGPTLRDTGRAESYNGLGFAATFFDAFLDTRLDETITDEFSLLCASAYYLADTPGSARVVVEKIQAPPAEREGGIPRLVHSVLTNDLRPLDVSGRYGDLINEVLDALRGFFGVDGGSDGVLLSSNALRRSAYAGGSPWELLHADIAAALCRLKIRNASRTILPLASNLSIDAWRPALSRQGFPKELWPAQQRIADVGLLQGHSAVIQMPTSAGKTRATELIIRSAFLAERTDLAVVVAPFRSLCHDIRSDLGAAFSGENVSVTEATDSFQNDLALIEFIGRKSVLVLTPEKLLYLLRRSPELADLIKLIIYDEGHQFEGMSRGPTYELLLTSLKLTLAAETQVILISAVIGNAPVIAKWLIGDEEAVVGGEGLLPTTKSIAFASWKHALGRLQYVAPDDPDDTEFWVPRVIERTNLNLRGRERNPKVFPEDTGTDVGLYLGLFVVSNGSVAVFCGKKETAANLCKRLVEIVERGLTVPLPIEVSSQDEINRIARLFELQLGAQAPATRAAAMGMLAHHANVPHGLRLSIEHAMKEGLARFVVCTSTLAQGVNFPIKYLIITGVYQGRDRMLVRDFHNLMGRAGRAGMHTEGSVIFSSTEVYDDKENRRLNWRWRAAKELLDRSNAEPSSSSLLELFAPFLQSQPPIVYNLPIEQLPLMTFADEVVLLELFHIALLIDDNIDQKEFLSFLSDRAKAVQRIGAFLLAHGLFDEEGAVARAGALAANTLAYELGTDAEKQALVEIFEGIAQSLLDHGDADLRAIIRRSPLPPSAVSSLRSWIAENQNALQSAVAEQTLEDLVLPMVLDFVTSPSIRSLSSQAGVVPAFRSWLSGAQFHSIHSTLAASGVRLSTRRLTVEHVVALCEGGFSYDAAMVIASLADLLEAGDPVIHGAVAKLQRQTKVGLRDLAALVFFEIGFADRSVAAILGLMFPAVTDRTSARAWLRANEEASRAVIQGFPAYFEMVFNEVAGF